MLGLRRGFWTGFSFLRNGRLLLRGSSNQGEETGRTQRRPGIFLEEQGKGHRELFELRRGLGPPSFLMIMENSSLNCNGRKEPHIVALLRVVRFGSPIFLDDHGKQLPEFYTHDLRWDINLEVLHTYEIALPELGTQYHIPTVTFHYEGLELQVIEHFYTMDLK
ncbi:hypothetical protein VNO77_18958 [Canavalia gladiata]|uniref:Uncharacterized protein n=1 Tax=Canavalia gladiata TaxID=3824 RepID=A0AAN9LMH7_CANGL